MQCSKNWYTHSLYAPFSTKLTYCCKSCCNKPCYFHIKGVLQQDVQQAGYFVLVSTHTPRNRNIQFPQKIGKNLDVCCNLCRSCSKSRKFYNSFTRRLHMRRCVDLFYNNCRSGPVEPGTLMVTVHFVQHVNVYFMDLQHMYRCHYSTHHEYIYFLYNI